ncbi:MAG: GspJ family type II secretion system protein [Pseudomonadota bacterium]
MMRRQASNAEMLRAQRGLTLPELLISLLIFSMISAAGVAGLRLAIDGREQLGEVDDNLRSWQIMQTILREDLAQVAPRTPRDEFGVALPAAFVGGRALELAFQPPRAGETPLLAFVRGGRRNPEAKEPRSELQYVEYVFRGDRILRRARPYVDAARNNVVTERALVGGLAQVDVEFLIGQTNRGLEWADGWPAPAASSGPPTAIRFSFDGTRFGAFEAWFWIGRYG